MRGSIGSSLRCKRDPGNEWYLVAMSVSPRSSLALRSIGIPRGFRVRGEEVSRVEGFSDAAFAFALTLLVISLEVPSSFDSLLDLLRGLPAFAVCFATIVWLWCAHYKFFRRYGLEDATTVALNSALLFVIMIYVFPLKFLFTVAIGSMTGLQPHTSPMTIFGGQIRGLFIVYGLGFISVFALLACMNWRAWTLREALELNELERVVTREEITRCLGIAGVGALTIIISLILPLGMAGLAGFTFSLIGVVEGVVGARFGAKRAAILQRMHA